jgi:hypothetical protein
MPPHRGSYPAAAAPQLIAEATKKYQTVTKSLNAHERSEDLRLDFVRAL